MASPSDMLPFEVDSLILDPKLNTPILLLRPCQSSHDPPENAQAGGSDSGGLDLDAPLAIWIGAAEAAAIQIQLEGRRPPRPMTHDLLLSSLQRLGGELVAVLIHDLHEGTFHASLRILQGERLVDVDARASDGIALALRCKAEILVHPGVLAAAADRDGVGAEEDLPELAELGADAFGDYEM